VDQGFGHFEALHNCGLKKRKLFSGVGIQRRKGILLSYIVLFLSRVGKLFTRSSWRRKEVGVSTAVIFGVITREVIQWLCNCTPSNISFFVF
jgi:hypothetical protein